MPSPNYTPTVWVNDSAPAVSAGNLNKQEDGIESAHERLDVLEAAGSGDGTPAGVIAAFVGAAAPTGWLLCDGSNVSRTTYAALFTVISTVYGPGDGSTTFGLPDLRGRVPVGKGTHASVDALAETEGGALSTRTSKHHHNSGGAVFFRDNPGGGVQPSTGDSGGNNGMRQVVVGDITGTLDGPAFQVVNYIVKT